MSRPRPVPGGSPQGSILGNFLFCVSTNDLTQDIVYRNRNEDLSLSELSEGQELDGSEHDGFGAVGEEMANDDGIDFYDDSALDESISFFRIKQWSKKNH